MDWYNGIPFFHVQDWMVGVLIIFAIASVVGRATIHD